MYIEPYWWQAPVHDVHESIQQSFGEQRWFEGISVGVHGDVDLVCSNFKQSDTIGTLRALLAARTKTTLLQPPSTYGYMYTYTLGPIPSNTKWLKLSGCFNQCESI